MEKKYIVIWRNENEGEDKYEAHWSDLKGRYEYIYSSNSASDLLESLENDLEDKMIEDEQ